MLRRIRSFIIRNVPALGDLRLRLYQIAPVRTPDVDQQVYGRQRLLIDVTHTSSADSISGIQRVVLRLAEELVANSDLLHFDPVLVRLERVDGVFNLIRATGLEQRLGRKPSGLDPAITIRRRDILLMLDSSWIEYPLFARKIFPVIRLQGGCVISIVYDIIPITNPEFCADPIVRVFGRWFSLMLRSSSAIVCISKATKDSVEQYLTRRRTPFHGHIDYFHLGGDFQSKGQPKVPQGDGVPTLLMVGTLEPRKGYHLAFAAFKALWARGKSIRLHIVGRKGWLVDALVAEMKCNQTYGDNLVIDMNASDDDLRSAYANADLVLSASLVEGYGLPLAEAAALGKSLMVSDIPVYREICGENAIYFTSGDSTDLAAKIEGWLHDRPVVKPPQFQSWSLSSQQLLERIKALVRSDCQLH